MYTLKAELRSFVDWTSTEFLVLEIDKDNESITDMIDKCDKCWVDVILRE